MNADLPFRYKRKKPHQGHPGEGWEEISIDLVPDQLLILWSGSPGELNPRSLDQLRFYRTPRPLMGTPLERTMRDLGTS